MLRALGIVFLGIITIGVVGFFASIGRPPRPKHETHKWTSTNIEADRHCDAGRLEGLDRMNDLKGAAAHITHALCDRDGSISVVMLRGKDGRLMEWRPREGTNELARKMAFGR